MKLFWAFTWRLSRGQMSNHDIAMNLTQHRSALDDQDRTGIMQRAHQYLDDIQLRLSSRSSTAGIFFTEQKWRSI